VNILRGLGKGALLALLGVFFVAASVHASTSGKLEGVVTDAKTGKPVPFCNVTIPSLERGVATDENGYYFLLNVPAGRYDVKASIIGYEPVVRAGITIVPDFTTQLNLQVNPTTATTLKETTVTGERALIQRDATGTSRVLSGDDIKAMPTRGYRDAVAQQSGVVTQGRYASDTEAQNAPSLYIRGGRSNSVAYYVDGFSTQDALTGISSTSINQNAVEEVSTLTGGFDAEYGRVSSGIVNVITKEGSKTLKGSLETVTDYGTGTWIGTRSYGNITYNGALSGPVIPGSDKLTFFLAGEGRNNRDRAPRPDITTPGGTVSNEGILPGNQLSGVTYQGKLAWRPDASTNVKFSLLGSHDDWQRYINAYRFDIAHTPRYKDDNNTASISLNRTLNANSYVSAGVSYNSTERIRGDGVYFDSVTAYSRNFLGDNSNPLYQYNSDFVASGHVWDDFFHRRSTYLGGKLDYTNQLNRHHQVKFGGDIQRHTLRFYNHLYPTSLGRSDYVNNDVVNYGFDKFGEQTDADSLGLNGAKHPILASFFGQDKIEYEGMIARVGLRWDYLAPRTQRLVDPTNPLDDAGNVKLTDAEAASKLSPRIGVSFPVTDRTDFRFNYGIFYQLPNLQDLYTNYDYLKYKVSTGGYYYAFGNPNLGPEKTTQFEMGFAQQLNARSALDFALWYKDIQGLVQVKNQPSAPFAFASFRNTDFGTLRGIDMNYTMRRDNHFQSFFNYTISWARGTGSNPQSQRNIAWNATEEPKLVAALDFDVRHKLSANLDYLTDPPTPDGGNRNILADLDISVLMNAQSGTPYTPVRVYDEATQLSVANNVIGDLNSRYKPWNFTIDFKATKTIKLTELTNLQLQLYVYNLLNRYNPSTVYLGTGDPYVTGYLNTAEGQKLGTGDQDIYQLAQRDPLNFDNPRMVRFGAVLNF
jgi:outer membrane receptor protein involved in Fe transport